MASSAENVGPVESNGASKRYAETPLRSEEGPRENYRFKNKRMKNGHGDSSKILKTNGDHEEILLADVNDLLKSLRLEKDGNAEVQEFEPLPEKKSEIEVEIKHLSSTGDGLGIQTNSRSDQIYVVPFTAPGDVVTARPFKHMDKEKYSMADFIKVNTLSSHRDDSLVVLCHLLRMSVPDAALFVPARPQEDDCGEGVQELLQPPTRAHPRHRRYHWITARVRIPDKADTALRWATRCS
jgi:tRNA (uracil-5-)-methyltransferase